LLVEDEPALRELSARVLENAGFLVLSAADGEEALERLGTLPSPPHVLVTDVMMPRMTGRELATRVRDSHPTVQILFVSGFSPEELVPVGEAFLPKPFTVDQLITAVRVLAEQQ
jgi:CheY-like chemotaxis protein